MILNEDDLHDILVDFLLYSMEHMPLNMSTNEMHDKIDEYLDICLRHKEPPF